MIFHSAHLKAVAATFSKRLSDWPVRSVGWMHVLSEKTKMAQAVVSQVDTRTGAALRAPTYSRPRSQSPTYKLTSSAAEVACRLEEAFAPDSFSMISHSPILNEN